VNDREFGRGLRAARLAIGKRQVDASAEAGISQSSWSRLEDGELGKHSVDTIRAAVAAVDGHLNLDFRWHGAAIDRLLDERHAAIAEVLSGSLRPLGWETHLEVTYSSWGERGSIDILALRRDIGVCLVIELKSEVASLEYLVRPLDVKARLAQQIVFERFGWRPRTVGRLVVLLETSTNRRRVSKLASALDAAFPARGAVVRSWLRSPAGPMSGLLFQSVTHAPNASQRAVRPKRRNGEKSSAIRPAPSPDTPAVGT
jgi:transcriptional regulator with XRE-family HTH domain